MTIDASPQYRGGGRSFLGANNQYVCLEAWVQFQDIIETQHYFYLVTPSPGVGGPILTGGGGGGAYGQGFGYGANPPSSYPTGTPLWGLGGDDFRATVKGVIPVASLGVVVGVERPTKKWLQVAVKEDLAEDIR